MIKGTLNISVFEESTLQRKPAFEVIMDGDNIQVLATHDSLTPGELQQALRDLNILFPEK